MPIKLPKGIKVRRRSSPPASEDDDIPAQPSFRLIEIVDGAGRSLDGFTGGKKYAEQRAARASSFGPYGPRAEDQEPPLATIHDRQHRPDPAVHAPAPLEHRRKSGLTLDSLSTDPANHSTTSSMRLSPTSTVPSSTDLSLDLQKTLVPRKALSQSTSTPRPPLPAYFDSHSSRSSQPSDPRSKSPATSGTSTNTTPVRRNQAVRVSSDITAPPRVLENELSNAPDRDESSNVLDSLDQANGRRDASVKTTRADSATPIVSQKPSKPPTIVGSFPSRLKPMSPPVAIGRNDDILAHPGSKTNSPSNEDLIALSSPVSTNRSQFQRQTRQMRLLQSADFVDGNDSTEPMLRRSPPLQSGSDSDLAQERSARFGAFDLPTQGLQHNDENIGDCSEQASLLRREKPLPATTTSVRKVMTPEQFERYKEQQEARMKLEASQSDGSDVENGNDLDEEEDEADRYRQAMIQRRKQEAHLSVFRQQMMKVTGEKRASPAILEPGPIPSRASPSLPMLKQMQSSAHVDLPKPSGGLGREEDEDDDEVPLGILAAHGFPSKNRPPSQLAKFKSSSELSVRSEPVARRSQTDKWSGESTERAKGKMPAFARKLPQEPHHGAGITKTVNRGSPGRASLTPSPQGSAVPRQPSGGFVGVGAAGGRPRAMRRRSSNARMGSEHSSSEAYYGMYQRSLESMRGMMPHGMPPNASGHDQASYQKLAQMHMRWMQQMQYMMMRAHGQDGLQMGMPMGASTPPYAGTNYFAGFGQHLAPSNGSQPVRLRGKRTMSTLSSNAAHWNQTSSSCRTTPQSANTYSPSIAPTERSNVGMASRYRPVSMTPSIKQNPKSIPSSTHQSPDSPSDEIEAVSLTGHQTSPHSLGSDEDDDDQAWVEMIRRRDQRKSTWKTKKDQPNISS